MICLVLFHLCGCSHSAGEKESKVQIQILNQYWHGIQSQIFRTGFIVKKTCCSNVYWSQMSSMSFVQFSRRAINSRFHKAATKCMSFQPCIQKRFLSSLPWLVCNTKYNAVLSSFYRLILSRQAGGQQNIFQINIILLQLFCTILAFLFELKPTFFNDPFRLQICFKMAAS